MSQAITTRYFGPRSVRGSRIIATTASGLRKSRGYAHNESSDANHACAAFALARSLNWTGNWRCAALNDKGDLVWVNTDSDVETFEVR